MRGNIKYQVNQIVKEIDGIGTSRHADKANAREAGAKGSHEISKATKVHSHNYERGIKSTIRDFLNHQGENFMGGKGKADIEKTTPEHITSYLDSKMTQVTYETFKGICTHLSRMETALENRTGREYNLWGSIQEARHVGKEIMPHAEPTSRYQSAENRDRIIDNISNEKFAFGAKLMIESGMRVSEASNIKQDVTDKSGNWHGLQGVRPDPLTGEEKGYFDACGKGGKWRTVSVSAETYRELEQRISDSPNGKFELSESSFSRAFSAAAEKAGVEVEGTHDLRHSWYQDRLNELEKAGLDTDQAREIVAHEMGHERDMHNVYGR